MAEGLLQRAAERFRSAFAASSGHGKPTTVGGRSIVVRQPAAESASQWSIDSVRKALDLHEHGDFSLSASLVDAMGRDDRISSCLGTRVLALASANGLDFSIQPPDGGDEALAADVAAWWHAALPDSTIRQLLFDAVTIGVAVARKEWSLSARSWSISRIERWHPSNVRWDEQRSQFVASAVGSDIYIEPGDPEWLVITPGGNDSWLCGAVRPLGFAFVARQWNWRDWARFNERHGMPLLAIKEPPVTDTASRDAFFQSLKKMGSTGVVRLPQSADGVSGYDVDFREAKDGAHATFEAFRSALDVSIAVCILGQNLTTEVQGGSLAAATAHDRIRADYLAADAEMMSTPLREQVIVPWCAFNRPGFAADDAPWPTWETDSPEDLGKQSATLKTFGEAVSAIRNAGVPLDVLELAGRFRVPVLAGQPVADVVQQAKPGPAQDQSQAHAPAKALATSSGVPLASTSGFVSGQIYVDDVVDASIASVGNELRGTLLADLLRAIEGAESYEAVRSAVLNAYAGAAPPAMVRDLVHKALVLSDLAGAAAVREDA